MRSLIFLKKLEKFGNYKKRKQTDKGWSFKNEPRGKRFYLRKNAKIVFLFYFLCIQCLSDTQVKLFLERHVLRCLDNASKLTQNDQSTTDWPSTQLFAAYSIKEILYAYLLVKIIYELISQIVTNMPSIPCSNQMLD